MSIRGNGRNGQQSSLSVRGARSAQSANRKDRQNALRRKSENKRYARAFIVSGGYLFERLQQERKESRIAWGIRSLSPESEDRKSNGGTRADGAEGKVNSNNKSGADKNAKEKINKFSIKHDVIIEVSRTIYKGSKARMVTLCVRRNYRIFYVIVSFLSLRPPPLRSPRIHPARAPSSQKPPANRGTFRAYHNWNYDFSLRF